MSDPNVVTEGIGCSRTRTAMAAFLQASPDLPQVDVAVTLRATDSSSPRSAGGFGRRAGDRWQAEFERMYDLSCLRFSFLVFEMRRAG